MAYLYKCVYGPLLSYVISEILKGHSWKDYFTFISTYSTIIIFRRQNDDWFFVYNALFWRDINTRYVVFNKVLSWFDIQCSKYVACTILSMDKHGFIAYMYNEDKSPGFKSNLMFVLTKFMYFSNHLHKTQKKMSWPYADNSNLSTWKI